MFSQNDCLDKLNSQWYLLFMISEWNKGTVKLFSAVKEQDYALKCTAWKPMLVFIRRCVDPDKWVQPFIAR